MSAPTKKKSGPTMKTQSSGSRPVACQMRSVTNAPSVIVPALAMLMTLRTP